MTPTQALDSIREDISAMQEGETATFPAAFFEAAFEVKASAGAQALEFRKPTILAETGFRMQFPQWTCVKTLKAYSITKPRRNPYAAQHGNH